MPDPPDKGRPSSPLSVEDADRLADSFTAFWEDAGGPDTSGPVAAVAAVAAPTPSPGTVTAAMPAVTVNRKPSGTLLGIAPITIENPPSVAPPPAAASSVAPPPAAVTSVAPPPAAVTSVAPPPAAVSSVTPPPAAVAAAEALTQPMPAVAAPAPLKRATPPEAVQQSTPNVPGYAIAYTPKDPPSTPAVVIAPEAQSAPEHKPPEKRREFSQTMPATRVRSAPNASLAPVPLPLPTPLADDFNPYARKKGKGKVIGLALVATLLAAVALVRTFGTGNPEQPTQATAPILDVVPITTADTPPPTPTPAETAPPLPPSAESSAAEPPSVTPPVAAVIRRASEAPPPKVKAKAKAESAAPRPVTRAAAPEPSPPPARPASKGVIVRDAPF